MISVEALQRPVFTPAEKAAEWLDFGAGLGRLPGSARTTTDISKMGFVAPISRGATICTKINAIKTLQKQAGECVALRTALED